MEEQNQLEVGKPPSKNGTNQIHNVLKPKPNERNWLFQPSLLHMTNLAACIYDQ